MINVGQNVELNGDNVKFVRYLSPSEIDHVKTRTDETLNCVINHDGRYSMTDESSLTI